MAVKAKLDPNTTIQRRRSADEMRAALQAFCNGTPERCIPPQLEDSDIVLNDCIEELLALRALVEDRRGSDHVWNEQVAKLFKR